MSLLEELMREHERIVSEVEQRHAPWKAQGIQEVVGLPEQSQYDVALILRGSEPGGPTQRFLSIVSKEDGKRRTVPITNNDRKRLLAFAAGDVHVRQQGRERNGDSRRRRSSASWEASRRRTRST